MRNLRGRERLAESRVRVAAAGAGSRGHSVRLRLAKLAALSAALQAPLAFATLFAGGYALLVAFLTADDLAAAGALGVMGFAGWVFASALSEPLESGSG